MFRQLNNVSFRRSIGNFTFWVNNFLSDLSYSCSSRLQFCLLIFNLVFLRERSAKIDIESYLAYEIFNKCITGTQEVWKIQVVTGSWPIEGECIISIFAKIMGGRFPFTSFRLRRHQYTYQMFINFITVATKIWPNPRSPYFKFIYISQCGEETFLLSKVFRRDLSWSTSERKLKCQLNGSSYLHRHIAELSAQSYFQISKQVVFYPFLHFT